MRCAVFLFCLCCLGLPVRARGIRDRAMDFTAALQLS